MSKKSKKTIIEPQRLNLTVRKPEIVGLISHDQALIKRNAIMLAQSVARRQALEAITPVNADVTPSKPKA